MDNFFEAIKDSDTHQQEMLNDCERAAKNEPELEYDMVVRKSWAEYVKEINRMRAQLRYMKKSVGYRGGQSISSNQRDIVEMQKEIKRLCKLRDCAKRLEKRGEQQ